LTRFLQANRYPPWIKSGVGFRSETLKRRVSGPRIAVMAGHLRGLRPGRSSAVQVRGDQMADRAESGATS